MHTYISHIFISCFITIYLAHLHYMLHYHGLNFKQRPITSTCPLYINFGCLSVAVMILINRLKKAWKEFKSKILGLTSLKRLKSSLKLFWKRVPDNNTRLLVCIWERAWSMLVSIEPPHNLIRSSAAEACIFMHIKN